MCYSAQIKADYGRFVRTFGARIDLEELTKLYWEREQGAASGTITRERKFVQASGVLGVFDTEEGVQDAGLSWARVWVDSHG